jgi:hypothetical protein
MAEQLRSIKIPEALYQRVKAQAEAEQRTLTVTLERMLNGANVDKVAIVDEWLNMTALNEVQRRWRKVTSNNVRLDGR